MCPRNFKWQTFSRSSKPFVEKNVAQNLQVEKIGIWTKNSEDSVKSRVTPYYMLSWKLDCNVFVSPGNILGSRGLKILSTQVRLGKKLIEKNHILLFFGTVRYTTLDEG